jgi:hypothetical protein
VNPDRAIAANEKIEAARVESKKLSRLYQQVFDDPMFTSIIEDLEQKFGVTKRTTVRVGPDGMVDPNASMVAAGGAEVMIYIHGRIWDGRLA